MSHELGAHENVENRLRDLLTKQRKHLDEIKKATNYDSTRKLIERYDDTPPASPSHGPAGRGMGGPLPGSVPSTPVRSSPRTPSKQPNGTPRAGGQQTGPGSTPLSELFMEIKMMRRSRQSQDLQIRLSSSLRVSIPNKQLPFTFKCRPYSQSYPHPRRSGMIE